VSTRVVPPEEFRAMAKKLNDNEEIVEKVIYVVKPILVPIDALHHKERNKTEQRWQVYN
jgi:hypothetical protein